MFHKFSRYLTRVYTVLCLTLCCSLNAFAVNPIMGDETQGTVKLMTVLLIGSGVLIAILVATSLLKKNKK